MGLVRAGGEARSLIRKAGEDFGSGTAEVAQREFRRKSNRHELLDGPANLFESRSARDLLKRNNATEAGMVRLFTSVGVKRGETS